MNTDARTQFYPTQPNTWLTVPQAAERLQCGRSAIYRLIRSGQLAATKIGGRRDLRIKAEWIDSCLEATRVS